MLFLEYKAGYFSLSWFDTLNILHNFLYQWMIGLLLQTAHGYIISPNSMFPTLKHIGSTVWALKVSHPTEAIDAKFFPIWDLLAMNLPLQNKWLKGNLTGWFTPFSDSQSNISPRVYKWLFSSIKKNLFTLVCSLFLHFWHFVTVWHQVSMEPKKSHSALRLTSCFTRQQSCKGSMGMAEL